MLSLVEGFVLTQARIRIVLRITFPHMAGGKGHDECLEQQQHNDPVYTHNVMKAYGGVKVNFHAFVRLILEGREREISRCGHFTSEGVAIHMSLVEHKDRYGHFKRVGESLLLLDIEIRLSEL